LLPQTRPLDVHQLVVGYSGIEHLHLIAEERPDAAAIGIAEQPLDSTMPLNLTTHAVTVEIGTKHVRL